MTGSCQWNDTTGKWGLCLTTFAELKELDFGELVVITATDRLSGREGSYACKC